MMQILFNSLISGLPIALLAVGFQLVYLPTRIFFIGIAGLYTLAPYCYKACLAAFKLRSVALVATLAVIIGVAIAFECFNHARLSRKGASDGAQLISSLGVYIVIVQVVAMIWGSGTQTLQTGLEATFSFGGIVIVQSQLLIAGVGIALLCGYLVMLRSSDIGLRLRALSDNPVQFALFGYDVDIHRLVAFGLAGIFAAAAGLLTARDVGFDPYNGLHAVLLAVVAVIIGGRNSFTGPILGGILIGLVRTQVVWFLSARWQEGVTFALLALFLLLKPQGLFGEKNRIEAGC